jgi:ATP-dependent helicase/nuclease subunit A
LARNPNQEQLVAIEHQGGVLLKAGAGSGKTFVLVEHIVHLTTMWMKSFNPQQGQSFEDYLRERYSTVVMMTFTKKAAGEMSIRLVERFAEIIKETEHDLHFWEIANNCLPVLMVTTIDGFCKKLISNGYFPHLSTEAKIIFENERNHQVQELIDLWLKQSPNHPKEILDIVVREKQALLKSFTKVFSDPGLRLAWRNFDPQDLLPENLGRLVKASFDLNNISFYLGQIFQLDLPEDKDRSPFEKNVGHFQATGLPVVSDVSQLELYASLFEAMGQLRGQTGKKRTVAHDAAKEGLSNLREWIKEWLPVVKDYQAFYLSKIRPWNQVNLELFDWIDTRLDPNLGMTFGDIEFLVFEGLKNQECRSRIQKAFTYFIVDEFQDTSLLQFDIIRGLIGDNFKKLFCVGDAKQAIYGFRGGELSVFSDCESKIPQTNLLANNYRSLPGIISFNNSFFETLLPLGVNFQGADPFTVKAEPQQVPLEIAPKEKGEVTALSASLPFEEDGVKYTADDLNLFEATAILRSIKKEKTLRPLDVCTILYSKLKPSTSLIRLLMQERMGFTAQFKIDLLDDPILFAFVVLLKRQFDKNAKTKNEYPLLMIKCLLAALGIGGEARVDDLENFDSDLDFWGPVTAFQKFLFRLNITWENSDLNIDVIETLNHIYNSDTEAILIHLDKGENQRLSLELRAGEEPEKVQIMSAHASKGLEFDTVFLGGIYTNGRENNKSSLFGMSPGSFQWFLDLATRDKRKSPMFVYEEEVQDYKQFSESKRLFYVACTRAKKRLFWVDFSFSEKAYPIPKSSWVLGCRAWQEKSKNVDLLQVVPLDDFDIPTIQKAGSAPGLPLFFYDPVGIYPKSSTAELMVSAELSVTRLNALIDCPRKFYFQHILKLNPTSLAHEIEEKPSETELLATDEEVVISSSQRGTMVHEMIAQGIKHNFVIPRSALDLPEKTAIEWALSQLAPKAQDYVLEAERPIKFRFFGHMISGIPDLILEPRGIGLYSVWDFKTGKISHDKLAHYWLQLSAYAYALYSMGKADRAYPINLVLCFVDEERLLEKKISWEECTSSLYPIWLAQNRPQKVNLDHCGRCSYGDICPR